MYTSVISTQCNVCSDSRDNKVGTVNMPTHSECVNYLTEFTRMSLY